MTAVRAQAVVDQIRGFPRPVWEVTVSGLSPFNHTRTYTIERRSDNEAAQEGIRLFVDEMEALDE